MTRLVAVVVLLALLLGAADVASRIVVQRQLEQRIDGYVPNGSAQVRIDSFPFLLKVAARGRIDKVTAHARQVSQGDFVLNRVDVTVTGVKINRSRLLHQRKLEIVAIDRGTVNVDMTQADFARLVGVPVIQGAGVAQVTVAGVSVNGRVSVASGRLRLDAAGLPFSVPVPALPVLPCLAQVMIVPGHIVGSCTFHQIPAALRLALQ